MSLCVSVVARRLAVLVTAAFILAGCSGVQVSEHRSDKPIPAPLIQRMVEKGMMPGDPIFMRIYKAESELEIWKRDRSGRFALLQTWPICRWSGQLGPKQKQGDRMAPEGFYMVSRRQLNPNSSYHLSFNLGYPNAFDRAHERTGDFLMVHGACTSMGCYAMTNDAIEAIYAVAREAFDGGQEAFQVQAMPFRMTPENFARHRADPHIAFWRNLKDGYDHFDVSRQPPKVSVCDRRYVFNATPADGESFEAREPCPRFEVDNEIAQKVAAKQRRDEARVTELIRAGTPAIRLVYKDGGMHASFREAMERSAAVRATLQAEGLSRPEALETLPREVPLDDLVGSIPRR
jgi:murein L,D-transpeptidase YafK